MRCCGGAFHSSDAESLFIQVEDHHWSTRKHTGEKYSKDVPLDEVKLAEIDRSLSLDTLVRIMGEGQQRLAGSLSGTS